MRSSLQFLLSTLFVLGGALPAGAQAPERVQVQFVSFPIIQDAKPVELIAGNGEIIEIELPSNNVSQVYTVDRQANWTIGKSGVGPDNKPIFTKFGETKMISSKKQLILVVNKGSAYADGLELIAMDGNQKGFSGGKYLIFNGTKIDIAGKLGNSTFMTTPGQHTIIEPEPSVEARDKKYLYAYLFFRKGQEAQPFYSSTWRYNEGVRCFVFVYHDPHNQRIRTHSIRDYLP